MARSTASTERRRRRPGWPRRSPTRVRARSGVPRRQGCRRGRQWTQWTGCPKSSADLSVRTDTGGHDRLDRRRTGGAARQGCVRKRSRTARKRRLRRPNRHRAEGRPCTSGPIQADSGTSRMLAGLPCKQGVPGSSPAAGSVTSGRHCASDLRECGGGRALSSPIGSPISVLSGSCCRDAAGSAVEVPRIVSAIRSAAAWLTPRETWV